jgi:hypothetical protein
MQVHHIPVSPRSAGGNGKMTVYCGILRTRAQMAGPRTGWSVCTGIIWSCGIGLKRIRIGFDRFLICVRQERADPEGLLGPLHRHLRPRAGAGGGSGHSGQYRRNDRRDHPVNNPEGGRPEGRERYRLSDMRQEKDSILFLNSSAFFDKGQDLFLP